MKSLSSILSQWRLCALGLTGCLLASIFAFVFIPKANLFTKYSQPLITLQSMNKLDSGINWYFLGWFIVLGGLYFLAWWLSKKVAQKAGWIILLAGTITFCVLLAGLYPFEAADIFDFIMHGKIFSIYKGNPYSIVGRQFPNDPIFDYMGWKDYPSVYGPLWVLISGFFAELAGDNILGSVIAFKALVGFFWLGCVAMLALILHKIAPEAALERTLLFAWNPVLLFEVMGAGHNDVVMIFFVLAGVWFLLMKKYLRAALALEAGIFIKFLPVLVLPAAAVLIWHGLETWKKRWAFLGIAALCCGAFAILAYFPFWTDWQHLPLGHNAPVYTTSISSLLIYAFSTFWEETTVFLVISWIGRAAAGVFALWQTWQVVRVPSLSTFCRASFYTFLFFMLVAFPLFHQWYVIWVFCLGLLLSPIERRMVLFFSFSSLLKHFVAGPILYWTDTLLPFAYLDLKLTASVMTPLWVYVIMELLVDRWRKKWKLVLRP